MTPTSILDQNEARIEYSDDPALPGVVIHCNDLSIEVIFFGRFACQSELEDKVVVSRHPRKADKGRLCTTKLA
jgi:hypothetical protein